MTDQKQPLRDEDADEIKLLDMVVLVIENARLLIIGPIFVGLVALGVAFLIPPTFTATTRILSPQHQQGSAAMLASQLGTLGGIALPPGLHIKNPADTYLALLKSRTVADGLIDRFKLMSVYKAEFRQDARKSLEDLTRVSTGRDGLITIEVDDHDPRRAAALANAYVEELERLTSSLAITEAQQRRFFFEKELQKVQISLKKAELALGKVGAGESLIKSAPQAVLEGIARLKAQVTAQEIRTSTMRGYLTESSPEFQLAQRELASLREQLLRVERNETGNSMQASDYLNRFRDFKYHETLFDLMAKQYELARLDEAREGAVIQVVDTAVIPEHKSRPKKAIIAVIAALASGFGLLLFVLIRQWLRGAEQDPELSGKLARIRTIFKRARS